VAGVVLGQALQGVQGRPAGPRLVVAELLGGIRIQLGEAPLGRISLILRRDLTRQLRVAFG
jgi:hypothetical protein